MSSPVPVTVTLVPPVTGPLLGVTAVIFGLLTLLICRTIAQERPTTSTSEMSLPWFFMKVVVPLGMPL